MHLIVCEHGLGRLTETACGARWLVAQGKRAGDPCIKDSKCNGCTYGEPRSRNVVERKAPRGMKCKTCGEPFETFLRNQVFCSHECANKYKRKSNPPGEGDALPDPLDALLEAAQKEVPDF